MKTIKYCLRNITVDGAACKKGSLPIVRAESMSPCVSITCIDDVNHCYQITIDNSIEDCDKCVRFIIQCANCVGCPPEIRKVCFCDGQNDCPDCTLCINGKCEDKCPGKMCDPLTEDCVDCIDNINCPGNQICVQGECKCPVGQKIDIEGNCVDCLPGDINSENPCLKCIGGEWKQPECLEGFYNPDTCECVECLVSGDCGSNECCIGGTCACCEGFYRDPITGECIEKPECTYYNDCPLCFECVSGDCEKILCPDGSIPTPNYVTGICECLKPCDCNNPNSCPGQKEICVDENKDGNCFCKECTGPCDPNNPCGEGCICVNGQCIKNPCYGDCVNGICPNADCGCFQGKCYPCWYLKCNGECENTVGCQCNNGICGDSDCKGFCLDGNDCKGPGCGCKDNQCVECNKFNCINGPCPDGCICIDGNCTKNPCENIHCVTSADCGEGCGCDKGTCKPCATFNCAECQTVEGCICANGKCQDDPNGPDPEDDCKDRLFFQKGDCELSVIHQSISCCPCENVQVSIALTINETEDPDYSDYGIAMHLLDKSGVRLSLNNMDNDLPDLGTIEYNIVDTYQKYDEVLDAWFFYKNVFYKDPGARYFGEFSDTDESITSVKGNNNIQIGDEVYKTLINLDEEYTITTSTGDIDVRAVKREIHFYKGDDIIFSSSSGCQYEFPGQSGVFRIYGDISTGTNQTNPFIKVLSKKPDICKRPVVKLYKSSDTIFNENDYIYMGYMKDTPGGFKTTWNGSSISSRVSNSSFVLDYGYYYKAVVDCGCKKYEYLGCFEGDSQPTPLVFCDPEITDYVSHLEDCGKTIVFDEDVVVTCPVYLSTHVKPVYVLNVNYGEKIIEITLGSSPSTGAILIPEGYEIEHNKVITNLSIKLKADKCPECNVNINYENKVLKANATVTPGYCSNDAFITLNITGGSPSYTITYTSDDDESGDIVLVSNSEGNYVINNVDPGIYDFTITDSNSCTVILENIIVPEPVEIEEVVTIESYCSDGRKVIVTNNSLNTVVVTIIDGSNTQVITVLPNTTRVVSVQSSSISYSMVQGSCTKSGSLTISCCTSNPLTGIFSVTNTCSDYGSLEIKTENSNITSFEYKLSTDTEYIQVPLVANAIINFKRLKLFNGTYNYRFTNGSCEETGTITVNCQYCYEGVCTDYTTSTGNSYPLRSPGNCSIMCTDDSEWDDITLVPSYTCSTGFNVSLTGVTLSELELYYMQGLSEVSIDIGSSIPATVSIIWARLTSGEVKSFSISIPNCYSCVDGDCKKDNTINLGYSNPFDCMFNCNSCDEIAATVTIDNDTGGNKVARIVFGTPVKLDRYKFNSQITWTYYPGSSTQTNFTLNVPIGEPNSGTITVVFFLNGVECTRILTYDSTTGCQNPGNPYSAIAKVWMNDGTIITGFRAKGLLGDVTIPLSGSNSAMQTTIQDWLNINSEGATAYVTSAFGYTTFQITNAETCIFEIRYTVNTYSTDNLGVTKAIIGTATERALFISPSMEYAQNSYSLSWNTNNRYSNQSGVLKMSNSFGATTLINYNDLDLSTKVGREALLSRIKTQISTALGVSGVNAVYTVSEIYTSSGTVYEKISSNTSGVEVVGSTVNYGSYPSIPNQYTITFSITGKVGISSVQILNTFSGFNPRTKTFQPITSWSNGSVVYDINCICSNNIV